MGCAACRRVPDVTSKQHLKVAKANNSSSSYKSRTPLIESSSVGFSAICSLTQPNRLAICEISQLFNKYCYSELPVDNAFLLIIKYTCEKAIFFLNAGDTEGFPEFQMWRIHRTRRGTSKSKPRVGRQFDFERWLRRWWLEAAGT